ncbi:MAG: ATP-binding protein [bacterium]
MTRKTTHQTDDTLRLTRQVTSLMAKVAKQSAESSALRKQNIALRKGLSCLKKSTEETIQTERLHALGQMASGIVHDFNNSLTPILGATDFLLANPEILNRQSDTIRLLENIKVAAYDAKNMVSQLREFHRPQEDSHAEVLEVNALVKQSIMLTRPKWREQAGAGNIDVQVIEDSGKDCNLLINATHLRQVITNLIINAVDSLNSNGTISIRTRERGGHVIIQIKDTGRGMTREVRKHCFEPFFSTKGRKGTGLGLSVTYGIIRKYGGIIRVASTAPGKGTTIEIKLPTARTAPAIPAINESTLQKMEPIRILVCERDPMTRQTVSQYLRADGHQIHLATSGQKALAKIHNGQFDLIILDALMPSGNGATILNELTKSSPPCAVIVTGLSRPDQNPAEISGGIAVPLEKPFTQKDLRNAITMAVGNRAATEHI